MPKCRVSCDQFSASDLNLFVDSIEEISRLESMKHKCKHDKTALITEDTVSYWDLEDMVSTNQTLSTINQTYDEILAKNYEEESIGHNSTCLATSQRYCVNYPKDNHPYAPELVEDEHAIRNIEFEDIENALDSALELVDVDYAVHNIEFDGAATNSVSEHVTDDYAIHNSEFDAVENALDSALDLIADDYAVRNIESDVAEHDAVAYAIHSIEFDAMASNEIDSTGCTVSSAAITSVRRSVPNTDLDAIEYADDLSFHNNITRCLPFDCTILEQEEQYEALYTKPEQVDSHIYQELYEPLAKKKKRSKLSKLNIFGLVRKKYKKCFPPKTYEWVKSTSWTRITLV